MNLLGPWTIRVCPDCGERVPDDRTIHGVCRSPGLNSYPVEIEVGPTATYRGAVDIAVRLAKGIRESQDTGDTRTLNDALADYDRWLLTPSGGQ
jgi:hypothetical protein